MATLALEIHFLFTHTFSLLYLMGMNCGATVTMGENSLILQNWSQLQLLHLYFGGKMTLLTSPSPALGMEEKTRILKAPNYS